MITARFRDEPGRFLSSRGIAVLKALQVQMNRDLIDLQSYIVREKLAGQVLHRRSGTLADSVRVKMAEIQGTTVEGGIEAAGGPAWYGRLFEEGGKGPYVILPKFKKALAWEGSFGQTIFARRVNHPPIPKKPWLRPAWDEKTPQIVVNLQIAARRAISEGT